MTAFLVVRTVWGLNFEDEASHVTLILRHCLTPPPKFLLHKKAGRLLTRQLGDA